MTNSGTPSELTPEERLRRHPMQYGYDHLGNIVYDPGDRPDVRERYDRCPACEQWSPCDVRKELTREQ